MCSLCLLSCDVRGEGRRFRHLRVESYALRIVIESGSVNLTAYNLESDWLNPGGSQSIPGVDSDLRHRPAPRTKREPSPTYSTLSTAGQRTVQAAHPSRVPGTAISDEDCDFLQMTEVPPASSVGERSPRRESTFSISPPSPTRRRSVTIGDFSEPTSLDPPHSPSPQPVLTSTDAPRHSARLPVDAVPTLEKSPIVTPVRRTDRPALTSRRSPAR